ncbi:MAG TPA: ABC transporter permease [Acidimicrobiia bacterium]|nr:ABC transporter permease [Acidimicrobiia bacterium]
MTEFLRFALSGLPLGCVYALMAVGLVLTCRTSGVFNLAFGAQAFVSAAVHYQLHEVYEWPRAASLVVAVAVAGPILGVILDRGLFRYLRSSPVVVRLVVALGLLVALPAMVEVWVGSGVKFDPPGVAPNPDRVFRWGDYALNADQVAAVVATVVLVGALTILLASTRLGLRMRAVVESPRLSELAGVDADRVTTAAWLLSGLMAGLAGVLLSPLFATLDDVNFTVLLVAAIAAAAFGRLSSITLTLAGGLVLGVTQQVLAGYLPLDSVLAQGLRPSLPFAMLFLLLLVLPGLRAGAVDDPLAGVDPPPPPLTVAHRHGITSRLVQAAGVTALVVAALVFVSDYWLFLLSTGVVFAIVFLSITVITGMAGMVSLAQATFAGVGAFTAAQLAVRYDVPILLGMFLGAVLAAGLGALMALPALRLGGVHLTLATLAFALMVDNVVFPLDAVSGGSLGLAVPRPLVGPFDFSGDTAFFLLAVAVFAVAGVATVLVRRGTVGTTLAAMRGSEVATAAMGVNPLRAKALAFALSAGVAGAGGALYAALLGRISPADFTSFFGLFWVVLVVTLGARSVEGALVAGVAFAAFPEFLDAVGLPGEMAYVVFGLGALSFARHPEGAVEAARRGVTALWPGRAR